MSTLSEIACDSSVDHYARVAHVAQHLRSHDSSEAVELFRATEDDDAARVAATAVGLLPDTREAKSALVEGGLERGGLFTRAVTWPVRGASEGAIDAVVSAYVAEPDTEGRYDLAFEAGLFWPQRLLPQREGIEDELLSQALLAGAPDAVAEELEAAYRDDPDPAVLRALAAVRTDRAVEALIDLRPLVPDHEHELLDLYMEASGVFPDSRAISVYPHSHLGFVVERGEAPHDIGAGFKGPVPECPICSTPTTRALTVSAAGLASFELGADPSFFWFSCDCEALEFVYVDLSEGEPSGLMVPMTDRAPEEPIVPEASLLLEDHPNQYGFGIEASAGFALHQVGGAPPWIELTRHPACPKCGESMRFLASVDSGPTPFGVMGFEGMLYGFWCDEDRVACTMRQSDEL